MANQTLTVSGVYVVEFSVAQTLTAPDGNTFPVPINKPYRIPKELREDSTGSVLIDPGDPNVACMTKSDAASGGYFIQCMEIDEVRSSV